MMDMHVSVTYRYQQLWSISGRATAVETGAKVVEWAWGTKHEQRCVECFEVLHDGDTYSCEGCDGLMHVECLSVICKGRLYLCDGCIDDRTD